MNLEVELTDLFGNVLLGPGFSGSTAIPGVNDTVSIESKQWEVIKRHFHYRTNGTLQKVVVQCRENDL
jgi:hypothetical protein